MGFTKIVIPPNTPKEIEQIEKKQKQILKYYNLLSKSKMFYFDKEKHKWKRTESTIKRGKDFWNWRGGITPLSQKIRISFEYRQWRDDVFTRDNFTCQECEQKGVGLQTHHIKSYSSIIQEYEITNYEQAIECAELWSINNGITLCKKCHFLIHKGDKNCYEIIS